MPPKFKPSRSVARQPAVKAPQQQEDPADPILFLGEEPAAIRSFHVKQDLSPRGRELREAADRLKDANNKLAKILLDTVLALCEDGTLDAKEWKPTLTLLAELADGTA